MNRYIIKSNTIYYMYQYRVDMYEDYKWIKIDKKEPYYGFDAYECGKKYCLDCGGTWWRERNKEPLNK